MYMVHNNLITVCSMQNSVVNMERKGSLKLTFPCKPVKVSEIIYEIVHTRPREA